MKRLYVGFILLVALGLAAGYTLVPGRTEMALMLYKNQEFAKARAEYEALIEEGRVNVRTVIPLSRLYLQEGEVDRAIEVMERLMGRHPESIRLRERLGTYYQYAQRPSDYRRNLEALVEREPSEGRFRQLADIYNFEGRYRQQVTVLERLLERGEGRPDDYRALGYLHARLQEPAAGVRRLRELERRWPEEFQARDRRLLVSLLLDGQRYAEARPLIEAQLPHGGIWREYYVRALRGQGATADLVAYWEARLESEQLTRNETLDIAFEFLAVGRKGRAVRVLRDLAAGAEPDSQAVRQLLYLWGPRPGPGPVEWLAARARGSQGRARQVWLDHLRAVGAEERAHALRLAGLGESGGPLADVRALADTGDTEALAAAIRQALGRATTVAEYRELAQTAEAEFLEELAHRAHARVLDGAPNDPDALRFEGLRAYRADRLDRAYRLLERYLRVAEADYEVLYTLGEVRSARGEPHRGQELFQRVLERLAAEGVLDRRQRVVRAQCLQRVGRSREAIASYRRLVADYPGEGHLRADYALVLMEAGRLGEARRILEGG